MHVEINLGSRPAIVQCGLCLHGSRSVESFCLRGLWSLHAYRYAGELHLEDQALAFRAGSVSLVPPGVNVEWHFPTHAPHYYVHFEEGVSSTRGVRLPLLRDLGDHFDRFSEGFEELLHFHGQDHLRAEVRLWDLLYQLHENNVTRSAEAPLHPTLQIALSIIRNRHAEPLLVGAIARQMGVSHNHLTQLFQARFGCGAREFIRRERISRACHLLSHSSLPIKSVAIETGLPDLHYFNKLVRQATGLSPRSYRENAKARDLGKDFVDSRRTNCF